MLFTDGLRFIKIPILGGFGLKYKNIVIFFVVEQIFREENYILSFYTPIGVYSCSL